MQLNYQLGSCSDVALSSLASANVLQVSYTDSTGALQQQVFPIGGARLHLQKPAGVECVPRPYSHIGLVGSFTTSPGHKPVPEATATPARRARPANSSIEAALQRPKRRAVPGRDRLTSLFGQRRLRTFGGHATGAAQVIVSAGSATAARQPSRPPRRRHRYAGYGAAVRRTVPATPPDTDDSPRLRRVALYHEASLSWWTAAYDQPVRRRRTLLLGPVLAATVAAVAGCGGSKTTSTTTAATLGPTATAPTTTAPTTTAPTTTAPTTTAKSAGARVTYGSMRTPAWSPDGTRIAWAEFSGAEGRIWLASSNGSNAHPVTQPRRPLPSGVAARRPVPL